MYLIKVHTRNCVCVHMGHLHYARLEDTYIGYYADIKKLFTVSDDESEEEHVKVTKKLKRSSRKSSNQLQDDFNDRNFLDLGYHIGQSWESFVDKHPKKSDYENLEYFKWNTFEYDLDDWEGYRCFLNFGFQATNHIDEQRGNYYYYEKPEQPKIGICKETGLVSITPNFPANCEDLLIEFLTEMKFEIHGEGLSNEDAEDKKKDYYQNVIKHLKFGVTGSLSYDN